MRHIVGFVLVSFLTPDRVHVYEILWYLKGLLAHEDNFLLLGVWPQEWVLPGWHWQLSYVRIFVFLGGGRGSCMDCWCGGLAWQCSFVKLDLIRVRCDGSERTDKRGVCRGTDSFSRTLPAYIFQDMQHQMLSTKNIQSWHGYLWNPLLSLTQCCDLVAICWNYVLCWSNTIW
jgi:hypothetical protein